MEKQSTILQNHIDMWQATQENHARQLQQCSPEHEAHFKELLTVADSILCSLYDYQWAIINHKLNSKGE